MPDTLQTSGPTAPGSASQLALSETAPDFWPWPERKELVERVRNKRPLHTGKIRSKDHVLCRAVMIDLITGELSERQIAARYQIGRETLHAIRDLMNERGELRPLEQTILTGLNDCIVLMLHRLREALLAGELSPAQMTIPACALIDKRGQLVAGIVPGTERTEAEAWESQVDVAFRMHHLAREAAKAAVASASGLQDGAAPAASSASETQPTAAPSAPIDVQASVTPNPSPAAQLAAEPPAS